MTDFEPFFITGAQRAGPWVITVDHATNKIPHWVNGGDLGLPQNDMNRHIAYDIGAQGVALVLGDILDSPVVCSNFSRLVIDPNRGVDDPTLVMQLYDGTLIPANRGLQDSDLHDRLKYLYQPYHNAIQNLIDARSDPVLLAMHSFTPKLKNRPKRPWEIGVLFAHDDRLSSRIIDECQKSDGLTVGVNEPYMGYLKGDSLDQHALAYGHHNTLIEVRNDLIQTYKQQVEWAHKLAPILTHALKKV